MTSCGHLGELAAALADGALSHEARDRAFVHMTWCADCRASVGVQRHTKELVASMSAVPIPDDLLLRLGSIPMLTSDESFALISSPLATPAPPGPLRRHRPSVSRRRLSAVVVGGASVLAFGVWAVPAGAGPGTAPASGVHPAYETVDANLTPSRQRPVLAGYAFARP